MTFWRVVYLVLSITYSALAEKIESACDVLDTREFRSDLPCCHLIAKNTVLWENSPVGTVLGSIQLRNVSAVAFTKKEGTYDYVNMELLPNGSVINFTLKAPLDFETVGAKLLEIDFACFDGHSNVEILYKCTFGVVANVDEHRPEFKQSKYIVNVSESSPKNTVIFNFNGEATDKDGGNLRYYLSSKPLPEFHFAQNGELTQKTALDYEGKKEYNLSIVAKENDNSMSSATADVTIRVTDDDDQNPKFVGSPYAAVLTENATVGTILKIAGHPIEAYDLDLGINSPIIYSIEQSKAGEFFSIDNQTGIVKLKKRLRRGQVMTIAIRATEVYNGDRSQTAQLIVTVTGVNEHPPVFEYSKYEVPVMENTVPGTKILQVKATDVDLSDLNLQTNEIQVTFMNYSIHSVNPATDIFEIHPTDGDITLRDQLDYEDIKKYSLEVKVSDGQFSDSTNVVINVVDVNDNNPVFTKTSYIMKSLRRQGKVGTVQANDMDELSSVITYVLKTHNNLFNIDSSSGDISLHADPSNLTQEVYTMTVEARDSGQPPRTASTNVQVVFPALPIVQPTVKSSETKQEEGNSIPLYALAGVSGFLLVVCIILAVLTMKFVRKKKSDGQVKEPSNNPTYGLAYNNHGIRITDFLDDGATSTQENPLAMATPGYFFEEDDSDSQEGQLRRVDEIVVGETVHNGNKPMGSPTGSNSSTVSLIGGTKQEEEEPQGRKKKSLSWGKNQQEFFNAEAPIDPDASVQPLSDDEPEDTKPKITLYF